MQDSVGRELANSRGSDCVRCVQILIIPRRLRQFDQTPQNNALVIRPHHRGPVILARIQIQSIVYRVPAVYQSRPLEPRPLSLRCIPILLALSLYAVCEVGSYTQEEFVGYGVDVGVLFVPPDSACTAGVLTTGGLGEGGAHFGEDGGGGGEVLFY